MKGVTSKYSASAHIQSLDYAVFNDCILCILGAGWDVAAAGGEQGRDEILVASDEHGGNPDPYSVTAHGRENQLA